VSFAWHSIAANEFGERQFLSKMIKTNNLQTKLTREKGFLTGEQSKGKAQWTEHSHRHKIYTQRKKHEVWTLFSFLLTYKPFWRQGVFGHLYDQFIPAIKISCGLSLSVLHQSIQLNRLSLSEKQGTRKHNNERKVTMSPSSDKEDTGISDTPSSPHPSEFPVASVWPYNFFATTASHLSYLHRATVTRLFFIRYKLCNW